MPATRKRKIPKKPSTKKRKKASFSLQFISANGPKQQVFVIFHILLSIFGRLPKKRSRRRSHQRKYGRSLRRYLCVYIYRLAFTNIHIYTHTHLHTYTDACKYKQNKARQNAKNNKHNKQTQHKQTNTNKQKTTQHNSL